MIQYFYFSLSDSRLSANTLKRLLQNLISRYKAIRSGSVVGKRTIIHPGAVLERRSGTISIGTRCEIHRGVQLLAYGGSIRIGDHCSVNPGCILYGHGGLEIGSNVRIAAYTVIVPANHVFEQRDKLIREQGLTMKGVKIGDDVWLGTRVTITDGVEIARGCVIGAGAVVTESTDPYGIYVGVPARLVKFRGDT